VTPLAGGFVATYGWALWLATPVVATATAAVVTWWCGRARRPSSPLRAARAHQQYHDALGRAVEDGAKHG
jgi:hypothetical protein